MKRTLWIVLFLIMALGLAGCQSEAVAVAAPVEAVGLAGTSWVLSSLNGDLPIPGATVTMSFGANGEVSGSDGCNRFNTTYVQDGYDLVIAQPGASTMMACAAAVMNQPSLEKFGPALVPGGTLLFTDYCCGEPPWSGGFSDYVASRGYCLHTISEYAEILKLAGFQRIAALDWTDRFIRLLGAELKRIPALGFTAEESEALSASWQQKIGRSQSGEHRWGMFCASI